MNWSFKLQTISIVLGLLLPLLTTAASPPDDFSARYILEKYGSTMGEMTLSLARQDNKLIYQSHSRPRGLAALFSDEEIDEISELQVDETSVRLSQYQYRRKDKPSKNQQFSLSDTLSDEKTLVTGRYGNNRFELQAPQPLWDRLSLQLALIMDVAATSNKQKNYQYTLIDKAELEAVEFKFLSEETLNIGNNPYKTLKFSRHHGNRATFIWLAAELDYLPVKVAQYRKDELKLSMSLKHITR